MTHPIDRRSAFKTLGAAGVTLALAPQLVPSGEEGKLARWLQTMLADLEGARRIGQAYLSAEPAEADRDRLLAELFPRLEPGGAHAGESTRRESFSACCRRDFAEGQTVQVHGWVLSRTEARLCALAVLA